MLDLRAHELRLSLHRSSYGHNSVESLRDTAVLEHPLGRNKRTRSPSPGLSHHPKRTKTTERDTPHRLLTPRKTNPSSPLPQTAGQTDTGSSRLVLDKAPTLLSRISMDNTAPTLANISHSAGECGVLVASSAPSSARSLSRSLLSAALAASALDSGSRTARTPLRFSAPPPIPSTLVGTEGARRAPVSPQEVIPSATMDQIPAAAQSTTSSSSGGPPSACPPSSLLSRTSFDSADGSASAFSVTRQTLAPSPARSPQVSFPGVSAPTDTCASTRAPSPPAPNAAAAHQSLPSVPQAPASRPESNVRADVAPPGAEQDVKAANKDTDLVDGEQPDDNVSGNQDEVTEANALPRRPRPRGGRKTRKAKAWKLACIAAQREEKAGTKPGPSAAVGDELRGHPLVANSAGSSAGFALASIPEPGPTASDSGLSRSSTTTVASAGQEVFLAKVGGSERRSSSVRTRPGTSALPEGVATRPVPTAEQQQPRVHWTATRSRRLL